MTRTTSTPTPDGLCDTTGCGGGTHAPVVLCDRCVAQLRADLADLPDLTGHVRNHVGARRTATGDVITGATADPPAPLNVVALDDADRLYQLATDWAEILMQELHLKYLPGPGRKRLPAAGRAFTPGAECAGMTQIVRMFVTHLGHIITRDWAADYAAETHATVTTISRRWPRDPHERYVSAEIGLRCPKCSSLTLVQNVPGWHGAPIVTRCETDTCGTYLTDQQYDQLVRIEAALVRQQAGRA